MVIGPNDLAPGTVLAGRYRVDAIIGRGSMGAVYRGLHLAMDRPVAIKMVNVELAGGKEWLHRFDREARATSRLMHPNTIRVFDYGATEDGDRFLVMELLEGKTLRRIIADDGPMEVLRAIDLCRQVLASLDEAHGIGVVHRDLKPANIFITPMGRGRELVKVLDFGVAAITEDPNVTRLTQAGAVVGTPQFMSPEQCRAGDVDCRADIYALGCILYELLVGELPYPGNTTFEIILKHVSSPIPDVCAARPDLPRAVQLTLAALMAKERDARPPSAHHASEMLAALVRQLSSPSKQVASPSKEVASPASKVAKPRKPKPAPAEPDDEDSPTGLMDVVVPGQLRISAQHKRPRPRSGGIAPRPARANQPAPRPRPAGASQLQHRPKPAPRPQPGGPKSRSRMGVRGPPAAAKTGKQAMSTARLPTIKAEPERAAATLAFEFVLTGHRGVNPPEVRIWVDVDGDQGMSDNEELHDLGAGPTRWRARRELATKSSEGVAFLVRFSALMGTRWRLRVWSDRPRRHLVFEQQDRTQRPDERVIGWCSD